ncbi:MAG: DUF5050 domain-containing protein [Oscillospiraceae bacterium]|nr:DUF5050 domain-containing protein [Oscillospiraceae bacterium]
MKRHICALFLLTVLLLAMSACGVPEMPPVTEPSPVMETTPEPDDRVDPEPGHKTPTELTDAMAEFPEIPADRTEAMSLWAEYGFGIVDNDIYYGRFFRKGDPAPMLCSIELISRTRDVYAGQCRILDGEHSPKYLIKQGDMLYYIMLDRDTGKSCGIAKVCTDGSGKKVLYEGVCDYLSAAGGRLFFTDGDRHPASIDQNGRDLRILSDRETFYLFALDEDWLIYQDDGDNESLHLLRISDNIDIRLNDGPAFFPVISGTALFFSFPDNENSTAFRLACLDLSSFGERYDEDEKCYVPVFTVEFGDKLFGGEFYISAGTIRAMNGAQPTALENWREIGDDAYNGFSRVVRFVSDRWVTEEIMGNDGGITAIIFHERSGGYASKIPWLN